MADSKMTQSTPLNREEQLDGILYELVSYTLEKGDWEWLGANGIHDFRNRIIKEEKQSLKAFADEVEGEVDKMYKFSSGTEDTRVNPGVFKREVKQALKDLLEKWGIE